MFILTYRINSTNMTPIILMTTTLYLFRFCGVLNSYVKRNLNESSIGVAPPQPKRAPVTVPARSNTSNQTISSSKLQLVKQETLKTGQSSTVVASVVEVKNTGSSVNILAGKTDSGREKEVVPPANKTKSQSDKTSSGSGGSLTNLWGRAKSKPCSPPSTDEAVPCPVGGFMLESCIHIYIPTCLYPFVVCSLKACFCSFKIFIW